MGRRWATAAGLALGVALALVLGAVPAAFAAPALTVTSVAAPGGAVSVSGTGYGASEVVELWLDEAAVGTVVTNAGGAFSGRSVKVPLTTQPGTHRITGEGRRTRTAAERSFLVRTMWVQERQGPARRGFNPLENSIGPSTIGKLEESWRAGRSAVDAEPVVRNSVLAFLERTSATAGRLVAVNADTGAPRFATAIPYAVKGSPAMGATLIYVAAGSQLRVYDYSGALVWTGALAAPATTGPTVDGSRVFIGDADGSVTAFPATCARTVCARQFRSVSWAGLPEFSVVGYGGRAFGLHSGPGSGVSGQIIQGFSQACTTTPCRSSWENNIPASWTGIAAANGLLWAVATPHFLAAFPLNCNTSCGNTSPVAQDGQYPDVEVVGAPAIGQGRVAVTRRGGVLVYDESCRGACGALWSSGGGTFTSSPVIANGLLYVADVQGNTRAYPLSCSTGCPAAWVAHSGASGVAPVVVNGRLYQATATGVQTYALGAETGLERDRSPLRHRPGG